MINIVWLVDSVYFIIAQLRLVTRYIPIFIWQLHAYLVVLILKIYAAATR